MKRYAFHVTGHVQGVGFRYHVQREATRRKLTGIVKNLANGAVYAEIQGDEEAILALKAYIESDMPFARVTGLTIEELDLRLGEIGFKVKY